MPISHFKEYPSPHPTPLKYALHKASEPPYIGPHFHFICTMYHS